MTKEMPSSGHECGIVMEFETVEDIEHDFWGKLVDRKSIEFL